MKRSRPSLERPVGNSSRNIPPLAGALSGIASLFQLVAFIPMLLQMGSVSPNWWYSQIAFIIALLLWGTAQIVVVLARNAGESRSPIYMQQRWWLGMAFFAMVPCFETTFLGAIHIIPVNLLTSLVGYGSALMSLVCISLSIYFWRRKRRIQTHSQRMSSSLERNEPLVQSMKER